MSARFAKAVSALTSAAVQIVSIAMAAPVFQIAAVRIASTVMVTATVFQIVAPARTVTATETVFKMEIVIADRVARVQN
jgi:hypothetical protein